MLDKLYGAALSLRTKTGVWFLQDGGKKLLVLSILALSLVDAVFAQGSPSFGVEQHVQTVLDFLNSPWVKGICVIALIVECIGMITAGRQEPGMFKKFIPWIVGTVLFMSAGTITSVFLDLDKTGLKDYVK
jgi:type IV secretory pathway VirB2 component (pilin)